MITDKMNYSTAWKVTRYANEDDYRAGIVRETVLDAEGRTLEGVTDIPGNLLLNEGIGELLDLLTGAGGTAFSNANSYLGVGDDPTAAAAGQTGLIAATNKTYKGMAANYPARTNQTVTFRAVFGPSDANHAWMEFTIANGNSNTAKNLNRKVSDQGVKASGQTWTLDVSVTLS
jgi:hypothetical protein